MFNIDLNLIESIEDQISGYEVPTTSYIADIECGCTGNCGQSCAGGCESGCSGSCGRSCAGTSS